MQQIGNGIFGHPAGGVVPSASLSAALGHHRIDRSGSRTSQNLVIRGSEALSYLILEARTPIRPYVCRYGWGSPLSLHGSGSTRVPLIIEDTTRVNLVEMFTQSTDLVDRLSSPGHRLIGVVSDLGRDFKSTEQRVNRGA